MHTEPNPHNLSCESLLEEAEALIWSLLDDQIDDKDLARLESMLYEHDAVRQRYVECVQLHVDLSESFEAEPAEDATTNSSVSNLLADFLPGADGLPSPVE